jgi:nicotinate-nucleotide--dimethylbenzimidazole phosphoribosyltransferase
MVLNFLSGGAAINVLCRHYGIDIKIIDMGVNFDFGNTAGLLNKKVRKGTRNFCREKAMTHDEAIQSLQNGIDVFNEAYKQNQIGIIGLGDMGIGNTTSSSAIISAVTGFPPEQTTGRGTGITEQSLAHKIEIIRQGLNLHKPNPIDGIDILEKIGGYEIGGIAGAILAAAKNRVPVVLDGIISTAGGLIASLLSPVVKDYLFAGHKSVEVGQKAALNFMGITPILDLNLRLGEGTGAALAIDIIDAACRIMREMASFEEAGVSNKE